ncbi:MAG: hypothetical protein FJ295_00500 [Planctomycetes bacterium]|nr:hypothetical protein [Planctomycetota bacterium]
MSSSNSPPRVACPQCGAGLKLTSSEPNQKLRCPKCGHAFLADLPAAPPAIGPGAATAGAPAAAGGPAVSPAANNDIEDEDDGLYRLVPDTLPNEPQRPSSSTVAPSAPSTPPRGASHPTKPQSSPADLGPLRLDDEILGDPDAKDEPLPKANMGNNPSGPRLPASLLVYTTGDEESSANKSQKPAVPSGDAWFTFPCHVCRTPQDCTLADVGKTIDCPDCHSKLVVPHPKPTQFRSRHDERGFDDGTTLELNPDTAAPAPIPIAQGLQQSAGDYLSKAAQTLDEEESEEAEKKALGDLTDVFRFAIQPETLARWIVFSVGLWIVEALIALGGLRAEKLTLLPALFVPIVAAAGAIWVVAFTAGLVALVQDTGDGSREVGWPGANFMEWLFDGIRVVAAMVISSLPAIVVGLLMGGAGRLTENLHLLGILVVLCTMSVFPIVFLSMLYNGSTVKFLSLTVVKSLNLMPKYWLTFYQVSLLCGIVMYMTGRGIVTGDLQALVIIAPLAVANAFLFFRMLGWLAWRLGETWRAIEEQPKAP